MKPDNDINKTANTNTNISTDTDTNKLINTYNNSAIETGTNKMTKTYTNNENDLETDNKNDLDTTNKNDSDTNNKNDSETTNKNDSGTTNKNDTDTNNKNDTDTNNKNDTDTSNKNDTNTKKNITTKKPSSKLICDNGIYSHRDYKTNTIGENETLHSLFFHTMKQHPHSDYLGSIKDNKLTYISRYTAYQSMLSIYSQLSPIVSEKDIVCLFSPNRKEWFLAEHAIFMANCITCPLYSTLGVQAIKHILLQTESKVIYCGYENLTQLLSVIEDVKTFIKYIICFDPVLLNKNELQLLKDKSIEIMQINMKPRLSLNLNSVENLCKLKSEDLATICYTSGTIGDPKGAMLSHKNFLCTIKEAIKQPNDFLMIDPDSVYISYLPLAHVMERLCTHAISAALGKIGIYRGNPKLLKDDIMLIKPTFIIGVPRVFNIFKKRILESIEQRNFIIRFIFGMGLRWKISNQKHGIYKSWFWDTLIFDRIKNMFGGKIVGGLSGSAPLNPDVVRFLQAVLGCRLSEGYGSTEATAANLLTEVYCNVPGNVGIPFTTNLVKLEPFSKNSTINDIADDNIINSVSTEKKEVEASVIKSDTEGGDILSTKPTSQAEDKNTNKHNADDNLPKKDTRGEILLYGDNIFLGYFKDPVKTAAALTNDGWLKTGDIGEVRDNKFYIIGRDKDIFKTSLGEYIAPDKIEQMFISSNICEDMFITGTTYCDYIVAIVVDTQKKYTKEEMLERIKEFGLNKVKAGELTKFEIPTNILLIHSDFEELDLLTASLKKKRYLIFDKFKTAINNLYV
ncbi:Long-chain-fatty-acid--CoA ligase 5 [Cucumispora dikerogammari]|nr:Long-chain-fatty-acid--CoA ligase 5 [Cucumispora dikerogammari]